jgi:hypothetical protein
MRVKRVAGRMWQRKNRLRPLLGPKSPPPHARPPRSLRSASSCEIELAVAKSAPGGRGSQEIAVAIRCDVKRSFCGAHSS